MNDNDAGHACPGCSSPLPPVLVRMQTRVCPACRRLLAITPKGPKVLRPQSDADTEALANARLKLGATGILRDREFRIVGVLERRDGSARWFEYSLLDGAGELAWLFVYQGHTSLTVPGTPEVTSTGQGGWRYAGAELKLFQAGRPRFVAALGDFPVAIDPGVGEVCHDYIAPPYLASHEGGRWTVFEYVDPAEVAAAFGAKPWHPHLLGINQPSGMQLQRQTIATLVVLAILALFALHAWTQMRADSTPLASGEVPVTLARPERSGALGATAETTATDGTSTFGTLELERSWNALRVHTFAPVQNAWVDVELGLVNDRTGETFWTTRGVEAYSGYDADGYWSEGATSETEILRHIPAGRYTVVAKSTAGAWHSNGVPAYARVEVYEAGSPLGNLLLALGLLLAFPGGMLWYGHTFEVQRWSDSPYDPYAQDDDE